MSVAIRTATRIQDQDDAPSLGAGQDGYALTWDNASGAFVATALTGSGLAADGSVTGATSQAQAFTNGIIGPTWKPVTDSTAALQLQNAAGTAILTVDTINSRIGIGNASPSYALDVATSIRVPQDTGMYITGDTKATSTYDASWGHLYANITFQPVATNKDLVFKFKPSGTADSGVMEFFNDKNDLTNYSRVIFKSFSDRFWIRGQKGGTGAYMPIYIGANSTETQLALPIDGRVGVGLIAPDSQLHVQLDDAATNAVSQLLTLSHNTSGTAAAGFGSGVLWELKSSTTADQSAARVQALWYEATHATRKADLVLTAYDTAEREGLRIRGDGSEPAIGFYGVTPIARATLATGAGASVDDVITALQNLGLVKQS